MKKNPYKSYIFLIVCITFFSFCFPLSLAFAGKHLQEIIDPPATKQINPKDDDRVVSEERLSKLTYSPDYCEFIASFPDEPLKGRRCETDSEDSCYDLVSYTKVFDLSSTVRVEVICNPSDEETYKGLTEEAMKKTVRAMTKGSVIEAYEVQTRQAENYRQAGLVGKGRSGMDDTIYISQLWAGKKSLMAVEAELIGQPREDADRLFAGILKNIGYKPDFETSNSSSSDDSPPQTEAPDNKKENDKNSHKKKPVAPQNN